MMTRINDVDYLFDDDVEISVQQFEIAEAIEELTYDERIDDSFKMLLCMN